MKRLMLGILLISLLLITYPYLNAKIDKIKINKSVDYWDKERVKFGNVKKYSNELKQKTNGSVDIDGKKIIGKIIVLKTGEKIPIIKGATKKNLEYGAALYDNGIYPGDYGTAIILGHRETTFGFLENVKIGDEIEVETLTNKYKFKLKKTLIVKPDNPLILKQEEYPGVTLDTCYPFNYFGHAPERFIARFKLI